MTVETLSETLSLPEFDKDLVLTPALPSLERWSQIVAEGDDDEFSVDDEDAEDEELGDDEEWVYEDEEEEDGAEEDDGEWEDDEEWEEG